MSEDYVNPLMPDRGGAKKTEIRGAIPVKGGTMLHLNAKKQQKAALIKQFGGLPSSIWKVNFAENKEVEDISHATQEAVWQEKGKGERFDKEFYSSFGASGKSVRDKKADGSIGALSLFPYDVARKLLMLYSKRGERIIDPFAGHATRLTACFKMGRAYTGYDVSEYILSHNREVIERLVAKSVVPPAKELIPILKHKSSELIDEPSNSQHFSFSSPPYWTVEFYGNEKEQLGREGTSYGDFLLGMRRVMTQLCRVLEPTRYLALIVSDFRMENHFYMYHADLIHIAKMIGFSVHDIIILDKGSMALGFSTQLFQQRRCAKVHEYCLVFRKPKNCTIKYHPTSYISHASKCLNCGTASEWKQASATHEEFTCPLCGAVRSRIIEPDKE